MKGGYKMTSEENKNLGFPNVIIQDENNLSEDMKAVGLIINKLTDILTEQFGFDVHKELSKRIDETETVD